MKSQAGKIAFSVGLLFMVLVILWLFLDCIGYPEPPSQNALCYPEFYLPPVLLFAAPWLAARHWYSFPLFFGYGAFLFLPLGWDIFGPRYIHGFLGEMPQYSVLKIVTLCCVGGGISAYVGYILRRKV
jgi:hypothetical protein